MLSLYLKFTNNILEGKFLKEKLTEFFKCVFQVTNMLDYLYLYLTALYEIHKITISCQY